MYEGMMWMGYRIGKQIRYMENGNYSITYVETDKEKIINNCYDGETIKTEYYNSKGELKRIDKN